MSSAVAYGGGGGGSKAKLAAYLRFDLEPEEVAHLERLARDLGVDLSAYVTPASMRSFGDSYVYNIAALEAALLGGSSSSSGGGGGGAGGAGGAQPRAGAGDGRAAREPLLVPRGRATDAHPEPQAVRRGGRRVGSGLEELRRQSKRSSRTRSVSSGSGLPSPTSSLASPRTRTPSSSSSALLAFGLLRRRIRAAAAPSRPPLGLRSRAWALPWAASAPRPLTLKTTLSNPRATAMVLGRGRRRRGTCSPATTGRR